MMGSNLPELVMSLNRDSEHYAHDRHGDHQPPHGEPGNEAG
jgi:hypothetical protein